MRYKVWTVLLCVMCILMTGCAGNEKMDFSEYQNGYQLVDLATEEAYLENGKKMSETVSKAYNKLTGDLSVDDFVQLEMKSPLLGKNYFSHTINDYDADYLYFGELKDERPTGYGMLICKNDDTWYVGEFEDGNLCGYGMQIDGIFITYEGYIDTINEDWEAEIADGEVVLPLVRHDSDSDELWYELYNSVGQQSATYAIKEMPLYIGEYKDGEYSGEGTLYYETGAVKYEGEFKNGSYHGNGTLYHENGEVAYEGEFKNGKYHGKGTLYYDNGEVKFKGKFKKGDVDS